MEMMLLGTGILHAGCTFNSLINDEEQSHFAYVNLCRAGENKALHHLQQRNQGVNGVCAFVCLFAVCVTLEFLSGILLCR